MSDKPKKGPTVCVKFHPEIHAGGYILYYRPPRSGGIVIPKELWARYEETRIALSDYAEEIGRYR